MLSVAFATGAGAALALSAAATPVERAAWLVLAAICIQCRLLCNLFDGLMAIEGNLKSATGELFNDYPDRVADSAILIGAGYAAAPFPWGSGLGFVAALLAVLTAYARVLGAAAGAHHDFSGPMAKQHRMAIITVACLAGAFESLVDWRGWVMAAALAVIVIGCLVTIVRRLRNIANQLRSPA